MRIAVKDKVRAAPCFGGTREAGSQSRMTGCFFTPRSQLLSHANCSIRSAVHEFICLDRATLSRFAADCSQFGLNVPPRSRLRPRLSSGSSVDGEKRSGRVMLAMFSAKAPHPGIPPSLPVSTGDCLPNRYAHEHAAARSSLWCYNGRGCEHCCTFRCFAPSPALFDLPLQPRRCSLWDYRS